MEKEFIGVGVPPDAILEEILSKCHSKTLVKLSLVCQKWKSMISNGDFKRLLRKKWVETPNLLIFSGCPSKGYFLTTMSLIGEVLDRWNIFSPRSSQPLIIMPPSQCGPNNNLVRFIVDGERFVVCDPSSRKLLYLPQPPYSKLVFAHGFCFLPSKNQYVIVSLSDKDEWQMITFCNTDENLKQDWKPIKDINAPRVGIWPSPRGFPQTGFYTG
ncbi:F-box protein At5g65850-like [Henckelia pumila]|uniref:F-box protein At5g65850-like n=1 Tax=Henckelia pumila TaxID=405737 RepID=UPI003C6E7567